MASIRETPASSTGELARRTQDEDHPSRCWLPARPSGPAGKAASVTLSIRCRSGTSRGGPRRNAAGRPPAPDPRFVRPESQPARRPVVRASIAGHPQSPTMSPAPSRPIRTDRIIAPAVRDAGPGGLRSVRGRPAPAARPDPPPGSAPDPPVAGRHLSGDTKTDPPGDRAPPERAGPATGGAGRGDRPERSHCSHRPLPTTQRAPRRAGHVHRDRSPRPPKAASSAPFAGSPGRLKPIYGINLKILAKLGIFCLTLCRIRCSIGEPQFQALRGQAGRPPHRVENRAWCTDRTGMTHSPENRSEHPRGIAAFRASVRSDRSRKADPGPSSRPAQSDAVGRENLRRSATRCSFRLRGRTRRVASARRKRVLCRNFGRLSSRDAHSP